MAIDIRNLIRQRIAELGIPSREVESKIFGTKSSFYAILGGRRSVTSKILANLMSKLRVHGKDAIRQWLAAFLAEELGPETADSLLRQAEWPVPLVQVLTEAASTVGMSYKEEAAQRREEILRYLKQLPDGEEHTIAIIASALHMETSVVNNALRTLLDEGSVKKNLRKSPIQASLSMPAKNTTLMTPTTFWSAKR